MGVIKIPIIIIELQKKKKNKFKKILINYSLFLIVDKNLSHNAFLLYLSAELRASGVLWSFVGNGKVKHFEHVRLKGETP